MSKERRYNRGVNRKRMIALAMLAILAVMIGTGVHELLEGPDATPLALDPDFILIGLGAILTLCLGRTLIALQRVLVAFLLVVVHILRFDESARSYRIGAPEKMVFYSPPPKFLPLRI
jgi:hypothetical protein